MRRIDQKGDYCKDKRHPRSETARNSRSGCLKRNNNEFRMKINEMIIMAQSLIIYSAHTRARTYI